MKRAIELSNRNLDTGAGGPFGAIIVKNGEVIGEGWNQVTSTNDPTAHAEVMAIRNACKNLSTFDLSGSEIYTSCEPCPMCLSAIYWARLEKIYFGNTKKDAASIHFDDDFIYKEFEKKINERKISCEQMMRDDAFTVFARWDQMQHKVLY